MQVESGRGFGGRGGAAFGVGEGSEFFWGDELVGVFAVSGPGDSAEEKGAEVGEFEGGPVVAGDTDERAGGFVFERGVFCGRLVDPELGAGVVDGGNGAVVGFAAAIGGP